MKKTLIALAAVAAATGTAFAQSSVTIYGVADVGISDTKTTYSPTAGTGGSTTAYTTKAQSTGASGQQSGSRIGFRGTEDLGGGLKAGFVYELGVAPTKSTGFADPSNRQAFVSVGGGFGEVRIGRQYTGFFNVNAKYDVNGTVSAAGYLPSSAQLGSTAWSGGIRADNVISYTSPKMGAFQVGVSFADDSTKSNNTNSATAPAVTPEAIDSETKGWTIGGSYDQGPVSVMLSVSEGKTKANDVTGVAVSSTSVGRLPVSASSAESKRVNLGASYDLGVAKITLTHNRLDADNMLDRTKDTKYSDTTIGVSVPMGAITLAASIGTGELKGTAGKQMEYDAYQVGAYYALSKRTNVYFLMGQDEGKRVAATTSAGVGTKTKNSGTHIGIRHTF